MKPSTSPKRSKEREAQWRERLSRQAASGLSVTAFCRSESISTPSFYWWRARLCKSDACTAVETTSFMDLGAMGSVPSERPDIDIRLDLPGGITLTITRR